MKVFLDLGWFFKQEKKAYITGIILLLLVALLEMVPPKIIGVVADEIHDGSLTRGLLLKWLFLLASAGVCGIYTKILLADYDFWISDKVEQNFTQPVVWSFYKYVTIVLPKPPYW